MNKTLLVGLREFRQRIRSRGFWLGVLSLPITFLIVWASGALGSSASPSLDATRLRSVNRLPTTIGYVDQANLIQAIPPGVRTRVLHYTARATAQQALVTGAIEVYYVVPADYRTSGQVERVSLTLPTANTPADVNQFDGILLANLLPEVDSADLTRLRRPFNRSSPAFVNLNTNTRVATSRDDVDFLPFVVTMLIMVPLFTSGGYLLQSLLQEKSSRVMEVLLLSLRPTQLLMGKLLGLTLLTLVQYVIWLALALPLFTVDGDTLITTLATINLSPTEVGLVALYAFGGYLLYATVMAGVGALAPNLENSRTWVFLISLPILIPFYLWTAIIAAPTDPLATVLGLIPFSAPVAMLLRINVTTVPAWQHWVSLTLLALTSVGAIKLMARLFRTQTLLSGESLSVRRIWQALTTAT
ncbi:MAG: ABC transporter permease [Caldilineaceae bacterium]|nr:ABC transporter permease [Caldilineaceae bacterium]